MGTKYGAFEEEIINKFNDFLNEHAKTTEYGNRERNYIRDNEGKCISFLTMLKLFNEENKAYLKDIGKSEISDNFHRKKSMLNIQKETRSNKWRYVTKKRPEPNEKVVSYLSSMIVGATMNPDISLITLKADENGKINEQKIFVKLRRIFGIENVIDYCVITEDVTTKTILLFTKKDKVDKSKLNNLVMKSY